MKKLKKYSTYLMVFTLFALASCSSALPDVEYYYNKAESTAALETKYKNMVKNNPEDQNIRYSLAYILYRNDKLSEAENEINYLIKKAPFFAQYHYLRGLINVNLEEYTAAINSFFAAVKYDPNFFTAHISLTAVYYNLGYIEKAKEQVERALLIEPNSFDARLLKIKIDMKTKTELKEMQSADSQLRWNYFLDRLLALRHENTKSEELLILITQLYLDNNRPKNALNMVEDFIAKNSPSDVTHDLLCKIYLKQGDVLNSSKIAKQLQQKSKARRNCMTLSLVIEEKYLSAYEYFKNYPSNFADNIDDILLEANLLRLTGNKNRAVKLLDDIYLNFSDSSYELKYTLALAFFDAGDYDKALKYIKEAQESNPYDKSILLLLAKILIANNQLAKADEIINDYEFDKTAPEVLEIQADILFAEHNYYLARKIYKNAQLIYFKSAVALKIALIDMIEQRHKEAIKQVEMLVSKNIENIAAKIFLAKAYYVTNEFEKAIKILDDFKAPYQIRDAGLILALSQIESGYTQEGISLLSQLARQFNNDVEVIDNLTFQLARQGRYQEALPYLEAITQIKARQANHLNQRLADINRILKNETKEINAKIKYFF